jgi:thiol-disulfide isomerase/thioredoxin
MLLFNHLFLHADALGLGDPAARGALLQAMKESKMGAVRDYAAALENAQRIASEGLRLTGKKLTGEPVEVDIRSFKGKVVLLDFWATWCASCIDDMPYLQRVYEQYRSNGLEIISLSIDPESQWDKVKKILERERPSWPQVLLGSSEPMRRYGGRALPYTLLIDKNGALITNDGLSAKELDELLRQHLGLSAP